MENWRTRIEEVADLIVKLENDLARLRREAKKESTEEFLKVASTLPWTATWVDTDADTDSGDRELLLVSECENAAELAVRLDRVYVFVNTIQLRVDGYRSGHSGGWALRAHVPVDYDLVPSMGYEAFYRVFGKGIKVDDLRTLANEYSANATTINKLADNLSRL